jgi:hypothetical protein
MKATVTEDAAGLRFEIKDDGSAEYARAAGLTREANEREQRGLEAVRQMSATSAGSHGEPVAWAVLPPALPGVGYRVTFDKNEAERIACGAMTIVPLYEQPQPTLTDAEREAIAYSEFTLRCETHPVCERHTATLRALLERTRPDA